MTGLDLPGARGPEARGLGSCPSGAETMRPRPLVPRGGRSGFTLVEMMITVVLLGILLTMTAPRIRDAVDVNNVRSARAAVANLYARARVTAVQQRKPATLRFNGNRVYVTVPRGAGLDTVGAVVDLNTRYGVGVVAAGGNVTVQPTGLVNAGAAIVIGVSKGTHADSVTISGYGRLQ